MRKARIAVLCLAGAFALFALGATTASAFAPEPEWESCVKAAKLGKTYTGHYSNKTCTETNAKGEGKYERTPVTEGTTFTGKGKAATITVAGKAIKCKKSTAAGEFVNSKRAFTELTFSSCAVNGSKAAPCESPSAGAGTIKTGSLLTAPVYLNAAETEPGVLVRARGAWAEITCGSETFEVTGEVLATAANTSKGTADTFAVNAKGEQTPRIHWLEGEENAQPSFLTAAPGETEATISGVEELGPKGVALY